MIQSLFRLDNPIMHEIAEHLNSLSDCTVIETHQIANSKAEPLERRMAAILLALSASDHPLSTASTRAIIQLTETGPDSVQLDPLESSTGKQIKAMAEISIEQLEAYDDDDHMWMGRRLAARVVLIAAGHAVSNPHLELILESLTGRDLDWWCTFVRRIRG